MKPFLLLSAVLTLLFASCSEPDEPRKNDLNRYGYKGKVKQIIIYKYLGYDGSYDSADFDARTLYDYDENGNVSFMQLVMNFSKDGGESVGINSWYRSKDGEKTGWMEHHLKSGDSSYGLISRPDPYSIRDEKFYPGGQLQYVIHTKIDSQSYREYEVRVTQYSDTLVFSDVQTEVVLKDGYTSMEINRNLLLHTADTIFFEYLEKDEYGNPTRYTQQFGAGGTKNLVRKEYQYY